ncbi:MAG: glycosyltransferase [Xanthobacteraceae bacterium]|nr:glycosyltransferase [Xanthobacteraceae bacterium]
MAVDVLRREDASVTRPEITVIIPLFDARIGEEHCVASWVDQPDFPADKYEILVVSDGESEELERRIRAVLRPGDRIERHAPQKVLGLYHAGAQSANADLLLFTELHCVARPGCLKAIADYFATQEMDGACLRSEPGCLTPFAKAESIKFEQYFEDWSRPRDWRKVLVRGFAVKKTAYFKSGGFEPNTAYFGDFALGAALHANGMRLGYILDAVVLHYYSNGFADFAPPVETRTIEECEFRLSHDPEYCHTYFDTPLDWLWRETTRPQTARRLFWPLARSTLRRLAHPRHRHTVGLLVAATARWAPIAACGLSGRILALRLAILWMRLEAWVWRKNVDALVQTYARTYSSLETFHRLQFISRHIHAGDRQNTGGAPDQSLNTTGAVTLYGFYHRQRYRERTYRWSAAAGMIGFDVPKGGYVFEIETDDLRGHPASFLGDVYFNGHRLRKDSLHLGKDRIRGRLEPGHFRTDGPQYLVLVCVPIRRSDIVPDRRELGLPLFGFRIDDERSSTIR